MNENEQCCRNEDWWRYHDKVVRCVGCGLSPTDLVRATRETSNVPRETLECYTTGPTMVP